MIVELTGLSGAGKTFFAEKYVRERHLEFIEIYSRLEKLRYVIYMLLRYPLKSFRALKLVIRENRHLDRKTYSYKLKYLFLNSLAREGKVQSRGSGVVDEGLLQFGLSLYERELGPAEAEEYFQIWKDLPEREVVFIKADDEVRDNRMKDRDRVPRMFMGEETAKAWVDLQKRNALQLEQSLSKVFDLKVIENN